MDKWWKILIGAVVAGSLGVGAIGAWVLREFQRGMDEAFGFRSRRR